MDHDRVSCCAKGGVVVEVAALLQSAGWRPLVPCLPFPSHFFSIFLLFFLNSHIFCGIVGAGVLGE